MRNWGGVGGEVRVTRGGGGGEGKRVGGEGKGARREDR